jgi:YD repeat-containing protein
LAPLCYRASAPATCPFGSYSLDPNGTTCSQPGGASDSDKNAGACPANATIQTAHPINVGTGNKVLVERDVEFGLLAFGRTYNSQVRRTGPVAAPTWTHTFSRQIALSGTDRAYLVRPDGRIISAVLSNAAITAGQQTWSVEGNPSGRLERLFDPANQPISWRFVADDDTTENYSSSGSLTSLVKRSGVVQTLAYSDGTPASGFLLDAAGDPTATPLPAGVLIRVTDSYARSLSFGFSTELKLVRITDSAGGQTGYAYDAAGNLARVSYPDGRSRQYLYNESALTNGSSQPHALTGIVDETGHRLASYTYDSIGRATSSARWADAAQTVAVDRAQLVYEVDGQGMPLSTTVTDGLGTARSYGFTSVLGVVKDISASQPGHGACGPPRGKTRSYDANGNVVSITDWNDGVTQYRHDLARNLETSRTEGLKNQAGSIVATADTRTITTSWHASYRLPFEVKEYGGGIDAGGTPTGTLIKTTRHSYDASGNLLQKDEIAGAITRTWRRTYTTYGRVLTATDPNGKTTTTSYHPDDDPDLGRRGNIATVTNAAGHITRYIAYNAHGQPTQIIDPNGLVTDLTYDLRMRLTSRKVGNEITSFSYDPRGLLTSVTLPDGASVTYIYDAAHRLTAIQDHKGNRVVYTLDAMGNRINEQLTDPGGTLVRNIARSIDALNRVQQMIGGVQ